MIEVKRDNVKTGAGWIAIVLAAGVMFAQAGRSHVHAETLVQQDEWSALTAAMERMHATVGVAKPSGNSDVDFVRLMLPHHQAALDMAKAQLMYGEDPQMRRLAQEIITDQQSEIDLMQLWLKQRHSSEPTVAQPALHTSEEY